MLPPPLISPYDPLIVAINAANARLAKSVPTLQPIGGKLLDLEDSASQQLSNNAWRKLQYFLANRGFMRFTKTAVVTPVPIAGNLTDPTVPVWMNWFNFFDGVNLLLAPTLPADFLIPLELKERITGSNGIFQPMQLWTGPLPSVVKQCFNRIWNWSQDQLNLPGTTVPTDIQLYYGALLGDFVDVQKTRWFKLTIPMAGAVDALSLYMCAEVVASQDVPDFTAAANYTTAAENAAKLIMNRDVRMKSRTNIQRKSASGRLEGGGGCGGFGWGAW